jgi:hypothetical protein
MRRKKKARPRRTSAFRGMEIPAVTDSRYRR